MTSKNFKQSMVNQDQEIIFEVVKVSGSWVFPAASSIVEATRGKNMYLRLTDDGRSDIFRLDSVKDGENAGETVFGFVGNGGMDLIELTATTDGSGATTGSWDYEPGEGPAGEAIGNLGQPLQWKGPATVSELNDGITGIQPGWTYTLTDAGTLTDGSIAVDVGDEVAWTEDDEWFKVGGEGGVKVFTMNYSDGAWNFPAIDGINAAVMQQNVVYLLKEDPGAGKTYYPLAYRGSGSGNITLKFYNMETGSGYRGYQTNGGVESWTEIDANYVEDFAPAYDSTATYAVGAFCTMLGELYTCTTTINTPEEWNSAHWTQTNVAEQIGNVEAKIGSVKNGGALTDGASVTVPNNALSTLSTAQSALTLNVNVGSNDVPNFAVEVSPSADCTLTVTKTVGGTPTTLKASVAGGNSLTSGKRYQMTCVGSCWTLAEFAMPSP